MALEQLPGDRRPRSPAPLPDHRLAARSVGPEREPAQRRYRQFVAAGTGGEPPAPTGIYLGREEFVRHHAPAASPSREIPRRQWQPLRPSLAALVGAGGDREIARAYREYDYRLREIAAALGVHYATVSRALRRVEEKERAVCRSRSEAA